MNSSIWNKTKRFKLLPYKCRICNTPAKYFNYGIITCHPCKMFFRRNAYAGQEALLCGYDGQCKINIENRHACSSCRLTKCFQVGMSMDKFQSTRQARTKRNTLTQEQTHQQTERLSTVNLLQSDQSLLTIDEWTLLTNLLHCYKESLMLPFIQRITNSHDDVKYTYMVYASFVEDFLMSVYKASGAYICSNDDIRKLSSNDRSIILHSATDNVCCMGSSFIMQYSRLFDLDAFRNIMITKYGKRCMDIQLWAKKFIDPDIILVKLSISLFAFSENSSRCYSLASQDLTNPIKILEIQNKYVDVTWKYLLYKYGHSDSVKRFLNLTLWFISINTLANHGRTLITHVNDVDSIIEQTELTLILDDADDMIEIDT